jgi:hypothetical protein
MSILHLTLKASATDMTVYPSDAFVRPTDDLRPRFETLSGISIHPDILQRTQEFSRNDISITSFQNRPACLWSFNRKAGVTTQPSLRIEEMIHQMPESGQCSLYVCSKRPDHSLPIG